MFLLLTLSVCYSMVVKKKQENKSEVSLQTCQTFLLIIFAKIFIVEVTGV